MPRILLKVAALLALLFLLDRGLSAFFSRFLFPRVLSGEAGGNLNYLLQKRRDAQVLVLGSSRAKHQIDPARLAGSYAAGYNAGINGVGGILHGSVVLDIALSEGLRPRHVILQADARHFFAGEAADGDAVRSLLPLYPFIDKSPLLRKYVRDELGLREQVKLLLHSYRFNGKLLNMLVNAARPNPPPARTGFIPLRGILDSGAATEARREENYDRPVDAVNLRALRNLAALCKARGTSLVLVFPPYWDGYEQAEGRQALLQRLHREGVDRIFDFGDMRRYPDLSHRRLWRDASHLNGDGAALFSEMLMDSLGEMSVERARN